MASSRPEFDPEMPQAEQPALEALAAFAVDAVIEPSTETTGLVRDALVDTPQLGDRTTPQEWQEAGPRDLLARAREKTRAMLAEPWPAHIDADTDRMIRDGFPIRLPVADSRPGRR